MIDFVDIKLSLDNIDTYHIRLSIFNSIRNNLNNFSGILLDVGCGKMPYKNFILNNSIVEEYIGVDVEGALNYDDNIKPDFLWDGVVMPFSDEFCDCILLTEVLEHCTNPGKLLAECSRVLKPGGFIAFTVPYLWPLHEVPNDHFRFTPFSLSRYFEIAGFVSIEIKPHGGWNASLAQMLGLWIRRSPMSNFKRIISSMIIFPFYKYLIKHDVKPTSFNESTMITGLSGIAYKYKHGIGL